MSQFIEMFGNCKSQGTLSSLCATFIDGDWIDIFSNLFNMDGNAEKYFSAGGTLSANLYGEHDIHSQLQPVKRSIESVR